MAYSVIDKVYTIFIDVMTGSSNGYGKPTFYNTDSHTSFIELTVTNGSKEFNMTEFSYMFTVEKPDGTKYTNEYTTQDKSKLVIPVDAQMISCTGNCNAQLYVNKEVDGVNKTLTMVEFNYTVYKGLHEGLISESVDFDNVYIKILNKLDYIINNGADLTGDQAAQLTYAYQHSKSPHAPANIVETMHTEIGEAIDEYHKKVTLSASQVGGYEGAGITVKPSQGGLTKNFVVKGKTLQNVFPSESDKITKGGAVTVQNGIVTISPITTSYQNVFDRGNPLYKPNTMYTIVIDIYENTLVLDTDITEGHLVWGDATNLSVFPFRSLAVSGNKRGRFVYTATTRSDFSTVTDNNGLRLFLENKFSSGTIKFSVMILEGDYTQPNSYIPPYFEGIKSVGDKPKNLFKGYDQEIQLEAGKTYYLSSAKTEGATRIVMRVTNQDDVTPSNMYWLTSANKYNLSADSDILKCRIVCNKNTIVTFASDTPIKYNNIQLEEGASATLYEPYFEEGTSLIRYTSTAKNIYNGEKQFEIYKPDNKWRVVTITNVPNFELGKNYTLSYKCNEEVELKVIVFYAIGKEAYFSSTTPISISRDRGLVVGLQFYIEDSVYNTEKSFIFSDIQIEEGTVATEYEPYQEDLKDVTLPIKGGIKALPNGVKDDVYQYTRTKNNMIVNHHVGEYTFTGDEGFATNEGFYTDKTLFFFCSLPTATNSNSNMGICNNFPFYPNNLRSTVKSQMGEGCFIGDGGSNIAQFYINRDKLATPDVAGFKAWLKANPTTVYYELANKEHFSIEVPQGGNLKTYEGATYVFSKNDFKPVIYFSTDFAALTTDAKQYCIADGNKNFILPDVSALETSSAVEIHLFVEVKSVSTLSFPSEILWDDSTKLSNIIQGSVAEFIFTYIKTADGNMWVGTVVTHK